MAKVLVFCQDVIGKTMAGPGIRYWEFATALSKHHDVTLAHPNETDVTSKNFELLSYRHRRVATFMGTFDVIITQSVSPAMAYMAKRNGVRIIVDAYDPILLEALEIFKELPAQGQRNKNRRMYTEMRASMLFADAVICASEKQRDLWIGTLMALDRVTPEAYHQDVSLRRLVDVVPFGVQDSEPVQTGPGFREKLGIKKTDKVLLWGGGIWNWFDPLTLIKAVGKIAKERDDVKLVFMGLKHPNEGVLEMEMAVNAVALAKKMGLLDKTVFFNYGWVPYDERQNHFLEADLGLSTHFDHLETRFSFRTRILDYFWTKLPIVATKGDSMADLVSARNLGVAVDYEDVDGLANTITTLLDDKKAVKEIKENLSVIRDEYRWKLITQPIDRLIKEMGPAKKRSLTGTERKVIADLYRYTLKDVREDKGALAVATNIAMKAYKVTLRKS